MFALKINDYDIPSESQKLFPVFYTNMGNLER